MQIKSDEKVIVGKVLVNAGLEDVWSAWTTEEGVKSFFAPDCQINPVPGGVYEIYFSPESPPGLRGSEGCQVMAVQPLEMLSFTWSAPPSIPEIRGQFTHVVIRLNRTSNGTLVTLNHDGWGTGVDWDQAYSYFNAAWNRIVLPHLKYRFDHGPIDWHNPPELPDV